MAWKKGFEIDLKNLALFFVNYPAAMELFI